jgi:hypothetical protein
MDEWIKKMPGMMDHACNLSTLKVNGRGYWVLGLLGLRSKTISKKQRNSLAPVTHSYNTSYSGGRNQEDHGSKPALGPYHETLS